MAAAPKIAGTCYVKVNGSQLELKSDSGIEVPYIDKMREEVMGQSGVVGLKEVAQVPYVKGTFIVGPNFPRETLNDSTDLTITCEFINGTVYVLSGGFVAGEPSYKSDSGELELEFKGVDGVWQ